MARRISLALAVHNHQPVGNFGWVFAEVFEQAYEPMVAILERHPSVKLSLHYTGPLLEWLRSEQPDFVDRLAALVARGQVELMGGGHFEPVLASLPERDRVGQLRRMADELESTFGTRPRGAWLAERVWEPDVPTSLAAAGYRWTILDDAHFRAAAIPEEALWGPYTTDDQGRLLTIFGTEQGLRYRIPFRDVPETIDHLRAHATEDGRRVGMMGDDGEKFGAWPTTWEHCWGRGQWMERFFGALEASADWLSTVTPTEWLDREPPIGRVYVPTGSYAEMGEWALPAVESVAFSKVLHAAQAEGRPDVRWLRGAFWRNFQVKYREINDLHKQMLRTSAKVAAMPEAPSRDLALDHLYRGQSNDCYWHGLFGGVYIAHMRLATHEHLIAAEDAADAVSGSLGSGTLVDLDLDGQDEAYLAAAGQTVTVQLDDGAGIGAWDIRAARHALGAVLARRREAYHDLLVAHAAPAAGGADRDGDPGSEVSSIHEIVRLKEPGLADRLHYDRYERRAGLVRVLDPATEAAAWASADEAELTSGPGGPVRLVALDEAGLTTTREVEAGPTRLAIETRLRLGGGRLDPTLTMEATVRNVGDAPLTARVGIEWPTMLLGGGGNPAAWWDLGGDRTGHDATRVASDVARLAQGNDYVGLVVETAVEPAADAWIAPIETISNSEAGFERVYQGSALLLSRTVTLAPGEAATLRLRHRVAVTVDRAAAEGLPIPVSA